MKFNFNDKHIFFKNNKCFSGKKFVKQVKVASGHDSIQASSGRLEKEQDKLAFTNKLLVQQAQENTNDIPATEQTDETHKLPYIVRVAHEKFPDEVSKIVKLLNVDPNKVSVGLVKAYRLHPKETVELLELKDDDNTNVFDPIELHPAFVKAYIFDPNATLSIASLKDKQGQPRIPIYKINEKAIKFYLENQDAVEKALDLKDEYGDFTIDSINFVMEMYSKFPEEFMYILNLQNKNGENLINKPEMIQWLSEELVNTPALKILFDELVKMDDLQKYPFLINCYDLQHSLGRKIDAFRTVEYVKKHPEKGDDALKQNEIWYKVIQGVELLEDGTIRKSKVTMPMSEEEILARQEEDIFGVENKIIEVDDEQIVTDNCDDSQEHWYCGADSVVIMKPLKDSKAKSIEYQIEIVNDKNGQPNYILCTRISDLLAGAYNVTRYDLANYPQDFDILSAIKNGTVDDVIKVNGFPEGTKMSTVSQDGNVIKYTDTRLRNGFEINRNYSQEVGNDGKIVSTDYTYAIKDESEKIIALINRSWMMNSNGTTTTIVNGKEYQAKFNDKTLEIKITQPDGFVTIFSAKDKYGRLDEEYFAENDSSKNRIELALKEIYGTEENARLAFYNFLKTIPADQLLAFNEKVDKAFMVFALSSNIHLGLNRMCTGEDIAAFAHELGHGIDGLGHKVSSNPELVDIYNKEMALFKKEYPPSIQELISYFSQTGGSTGSGLSELFAETNLLKVSYGQLEPRLKTRAHYVFEYFPETVAYISKLLGYSS